ncbi:hypothetical protein K458DRAFT_418787 [Lentithecium fluviatile CBS 122367]|uniref:Uncharacterized protein n=1 Tax=Lentithecium fluviatile CBS 122367 TaxID=1168545 RepID=A0A6G1J097_9PLEO|nr:hypothetical protein K458DRAFT_418787 [Lentithecium fluviatile CBS 122367]
MNEKKLNEKERLCNRLTQSVEDLTFREFHKFLDIDDSGHYKPTCLSIPLLEDFLATRFQSFPKLRDFTLIVAKPEGYAPLQKRLTLAPSENPCRFSFQMVDLRDECVEIWRVRNSYLEDQQENTEWSNKNTCIRGKRTLFGFVETFLPVFSVVLL